jgi:hypothetical protein
MLIMSRYWALLVCMLATTVVASGGCRSCSNCHDYDPPVASADCAACGCHRAGSASGGHVSEGYVTEEYVVEPPTNAAPPGNADDPDAPASSSEMPATEAR